MKVAISNPTNWPLVRRGTERFINDFARFLGGRGHDVTVISAHPDKREIRHESGYVTVLQRRLWQPWMEKKAGILEFHVFFLNALAALTRQRFDVVVSCTFMDALAASLARTITGAPCIFWVNGLPPRIQYFRSVSMKGAAFRKAIHRCDEVVVLSEYMQNDLGARFGRPGLRLPVPVDLSRFPFNNRRDHDRPKILCTAALDDRRKGGRTLMRAFTMVKRARPSAILQISCRTTENLRRELLDCVAAEHRDAVQFLGAGEVEQLPALMGQAAISVLPSRWEPFGLVTIESLATGTPVVATRDGAIPEILNDTAVGRLFDPGPEHSPEPENVPGLASAMLECLELSRNPETAPRCREHVAPYDWVELGPHFERLLFDTAAKRRSNKAGARTAVPQ